MTQGDRAEILKSEYQHQIEKGTTPAWAEMYAHDAVWRAEAAANRPDESRLKGGFLKVEASADRQTRGGEIADLDTSLRALEAVAKIAAESGSQAQKDRIEAAVKAVARQGKGHVGRCRARKTELRTLRKCIGKLIDVGQYDAWDFYGDYVMEFLLKIEAELSYIGDTKGGTMHVDKIVSMLPRHVERVGRDAVMQRFKDMLAKYADMYRDAALAAVDSGDFKMPKLITGADVGVGFNLDAADLKRHFPGGRTFIRARDRDAIDADRRARGLKIRVKPKPLTREQIRDRANDQRDIEALVAHFGYTRETVQRWRMSKPKPGSDLYGEKFNDMLDLMGEQKAAGIDPKSELAPELRAELMKHFDVTDAAIRQWKRRKQLDARVAQYRRETAVQVVA